MWRNQNEYAIEMEVSIHITSYVSMVYDNRNIWGILNRIAFRFTFPGDRKPEQLLDVRGMVEYIVEGFKCRAIFNGEDKAEAKKKYHDAYGIDWIYSVKERKVGQSLCQ